MTGSIVGGHQRYKVLAGEDATEIDCVVVHIESPQNEKTLNITLKDTIAISAMRKNLPITIRGGISTVRQFKWTCRWR